MITSTDPPIPADDLEFVMVYSVMDTFPVFMTYITGDVIQPIVFIRGAPIPYREFVILLTERMHGPKAMDYYVVDHTMLERIENTIKSLWTMVSLPREVNDTINTDVLERYFKNMIDYGYRARDFIYMMAATKLVRDNYALYVLDADSLRAYIDKLEDRYAESLESPIVVNTCPP